MREEIRARAFLRAELSITALLLQVAASATAQVVELNPVPLSGNIRIGDFVITSLTVRAESSVGSSTAQIPLPPDTVDATYSTIVQVPAGGVVAYFITVTANLRTADGSQAFSFGFRKPTGVGVQDGVPATLDLILDPPALIRATVTALPGELLERVSLFAERWDSGGFASFNTFLDAPPDGVETLTLDLPVGPGVLLRCFGGATMTNGRNAPLEPFQLVTVPEGGVEPCDLTPEPPPPTGTIRGAVDFAGDLPVDEYQIFIHRRGTGAEPPDLTLSPPFTGPDNRAEYEFTDVEQGQYDLDGLVLMGGGADRVTFELASNLGVSGGTTTVTGAEVCQARIDTSFVLGGLTRENEWSFGERPVFATRLGETSGTSRPLADPREGPVRLVVTEGTWQQGMTFHIQRDPFAPGGFTSTSTTGSGLRFQPLIPIDCFETVATPDRVLETGRVEVRFQVAGGGFLQNPLIRAFCSLEDENGQEIYRYEAGAGSANPGASVAVGVVPLEAPAGVCDFVATARVNGVTVTFGSLNDVEILPGVEVVIGLDGPRIEILSPEPGAVVDAREILVTGTATDDGAVLKVTVNGVEAALVSTGNPADPREVAFSATVPLEPGENRITAAATDDDANVTEASLSIDNAAPPPAAVPCDVDGDRIVDSSDIAEIFAARGRPASGPDDPRDVNADGLITVNDGRLCVLECTNPRCEP